MASSSDLSQQSQRDREPSGIEPPAVVDSDHASTPGVNSLSKCLNCETVLQGPYCHQCGQHDFEFHRSFRHVLLEALETWLHFDGKFFRNVGSLLFRPGRISQDFNDGRRAAQVPPFRLYIFVSFVFFLVTVLQPHSAEDLLVSTDARSDSTVAAAVPAPGTPSEAKASESVSRNIGVSVPGRVMAPLPERSADLPKAASDQTSDFARSFLGKLHQAGEEKQQTLDAFLHAVPKMMLVCVPLFALYTRMLYRERALVYLHHLVISVHYHTSLFLWLLLSEALTYLVGCISPALAGPVDIGAGIWLLVYPIVMLRRLFGDSWLRTTLKSVALSAVYGATLIAGFAATLIVVVLTR